MAVSLGQKPENQETEHKNIKEPKKTNKEILESKTVLIVDDDDLVRESLCDIVRFLGVRVAEASDGEKAKELLKENQYDLVITDIRMPRCTGVELVEWCRKVYDTSFRLETELPFVVITGFSHIVDTQRVHELGVEYFLTKPFRDAEIFKVVKEVFGIKKESKDEDEETGGFSQRKYCRVSLADFVSEKNIEMDVYVKLSKNKFVKIAHKGGKLSEGRIRQYQQKGIQHLYIEKSHFHKVLGFNLKLSNLISKSDKLHKEKKKHFMEYTAEVILENTFVNGIDEKSFSDTKKFLTNCMDCLVEDNDIFKLLESLTNHTDHLYAHSLGVSIYSVLIAKALGFSRSSTLFHLSAGGLFHDIGKKEFDPELVAKSRIQLNHKERKMLETHALRGKEILESIKSMPSDVVAIAYDHHENCFGHGYPRQLTKEQIHPLARIVSIADEFCKYALPNEHHHGMDALSAKKMMDEHKKDSLDPKMYMGLELLLKSSCSSKDYAA